MPPLFTRSWTIRYFRLSEKLGCGRLLAPRLLAVLLSLSGCRHAQFAFTAQPLAAVPRAAFAKAARPALPSVRNQLTAAPGAPEVAADIIPVKQQKPRPTNKALTRRHVLLRVQHQLQAPSDTLLRSVVGRRHFVASGPNTRWEKVRYFLGSVLRWTIYLSLVELAGWLVFLVVKWSFALEAGAGIFFGIPLIFLALLVFSFVVIFGFFALVSEVPM